MVLLIAAVLSAAPVVRVEVTLDAGETKRTIRFVPGQGKKREVAPDLGETVEQLEVVLAKGIDPASVRVEARATNAMQISDSGPHIELVDWKTAVSDWHPVEAINARRGVFRATYSGPEPAFPTFTEEEFAAAARKASPELGARAATRAEGITIGPIRTKTELRVQVKEGEAWRTVETIEIREVTGC